MDSLKNPEPSLQSIKNDNLKFIFLFVKMIRGNIWLQDKAVYPLIGFITTALTMATSFGTYKLIQNPDVQISKQKRKTIFR